ncbi:MAG: hypothetical protein PHO37_00545 [Kiritimatiellae bacterium]|nr:hypothetical protein [Kiritimatiellia bacterium]
MHYSIIAFTVTSRQPALEQATVVALCSYAGHGKVEQQTLQGSRLLFTLPSHGVKAKRDLSGHRYCEA